MKQTPSLLFILALCAISWAAIVVVVVLFVHWIGWTIGVSVMAAMVLCALGLFAREVRNSVDAGD